MFDPPRYFYWEEARVLFELRVCFLGIACLSASKLCRFSAFLKLLHTYGLLVGGKDRAFGDGSQQKQTQIEPGGKTC
jgi:hypothetical protein